MLDCVLNILWMGEEDAATAYRNVGRCLGAILPGPRIHCFEQYFVRAEHVGVGEGLLLFQRFESVVDPGCKGGMLEPPHNGRVFLFG
jgi:hypothetical protein